MAGNLIIVTINGRVDTIWGDSGLTELRLEFIELDEPGGAEALDDCPVDLHKLYSRGSR